MKIAISCESACDLTKQLIQQNNIHVIPFHVVLGDEEVLDDGSFTSENLFEFVQKNGVLPKTAAITVGEYEDFFKGILKNYDAVIHIGISSELSSTQNNAVMAANNVKNVYVIDSKNLSTGIGLLVLSACEKVKSGMECAKIVQQLNAEVQRVQASFILNTLKYMHKGGRCSVFTLLGASALGIKPEIKVSNGKMGVGKKYKGKLDVVLNNYVNDVLSKNNPDLTCAFVTYSSRPDCADKIVEKVKEFGFSQVYETTAGATVSSHCGPLTLGVLFINKE